MTNEPCVLHSGMVAQFNAICTKLEMIEKSIAKQLDMHERQVSMTALDLERRLEAMNEIRSQLNRQAETFITKAEVALLIDKLDVKFSPMLNLTQQNIGGKKWEDHIVTVLIGMAVLVIIWIMQHGIK